MAELAELNDDKKRKEKGPDERLNTCNKQLKSPVYEPERNNVHNYQRYQTAYKV